MIVKNKRIGLKTIALLLTVLVLALFTLNSEKIMIEKEDTLQYLMSMDLGFSSRYNLVDDGRKEFHSDRSELRSEYKRLIAPAIIKSIPGILKYKITTSDFERIDINIKHLEYQKILSDRSNAIKKIMLSNPTTVNAKLRFKGKTYKAKIRLKGDYFDHWYSKRRMSFRVNLNSKKTILGFSRFSLQKPHVRTYPYDYVFQSLMRDAGNLSPIHNFVHVYVNGDNWGIMDMEEHMSKEFLEKQNRKESIIIRFSNEKKWLYNESLNPYPLYRLSDPSIYAKLYNSKKYLKDYQYRKIYSYILKQHKDNNARLYDVDSFTKSYIAAMAWNDFHTLMGANSRYYLNPYTLNLEVITTDALSFSILNKLEDIHWYDPVVQYSNLFLLPSYVNNLSRNLSNVSSAIFHKIQQHFDHAVELFPVDIRKSTKIIKDNMRKILDKKKYYLLAPLKKQKSVDHEKLILPTKQQAREFQEHLYVRHYTDGTLELHNLLPDNVTVKDIFFNGNPTSIKETTVPSYLTNPNPLIIKTPYKGVQDNMFTINTQYQGFNRTIKNDITLVSDGIENPLLLNTAHEFEFIKTLDGKTHEIKQGNWVVNKPIIIEGDLHIDPGVNLQFSKDSYLIVKGSLTAIGGEANPITFKAKSDSWKGIYVLNADKKSSLKNINISDISALEDDLLRLTGGITFYKSDVDLDKVRINNVKAEDAINIVKSEFSLNSVYINNTVSDGLDSDFSRGHILDSDFSNIGGDALDFSGSKISISQTKVTNVKDKAVSAGEKSTLSIKDSNFNHVGVGIASKDGSSVDVINTKILNYKLYAAMSYVKKDFYDAPKININNCSVSAGNAYIRQKGTSMIVDNIKIPESDISVKKLYKSRVMAK